jgi:hypothetical protein
MKKPHVHWVNFQHRGYLIVELTAERALDQWRLVDTVASLQHNEFVGHSMVAISGSNRLVDA